MFENFTPGQIVLLIIIGVLALSSFINNVGSASEKVAKAWKAAKAPNDAQNERLADHEERIKNMEAQLNHGNDRFESIDASNRITQRAILALLDHGIDGNNTDQMKAAKEELQRHLIDK